MPDLSNIPIGPSEANAFPSPLAAPVDVPISEIESAPPPGTEVPKTSSQGLKPTAVFEDLPSTVAAIPAIKGLEVGAPPAFRVPPGEFYPSLEPLVDNIDKVLEAGLDIMELPNGDSVVFNPAMIDKEEIALAAQTGKLEQMIPDYGSISGESPSTNESEINRLTKKLEKMPGKLARLQKEEEPVSGVPPGAPLGSAPPPPLSIPPPPPSTTSSIQRQRLQGLVPGGPTSGPVPGSGRILNSLLRPTV